MLAARLNDTVRIFHVTRSVGSGGDPETGETDIFGNPLYEEDLGVEYPAWVVVVGSREEQTDRSTRVVHARVTLLATAEVEATDEVEWDGRRWTIEGEPKVSRNRNGDHHKSIVIRFEED